MRETILVIGSNGQIGTELVEALRQINGNEQVIACDIREPQTYTGPFEQVNVLDQENLRSLSTNTNPPKYIS